MVTWERIYPEAWNLELLPLITEREAEMPSFAIKSRNTSPIKESTVEADTREHAIQAAVEAAGEGETVEVLNVEPVPVPPVPPDVVPEALPPPA